MCMQLVMVVALFITPFPQIWLFSCVWLHAGAAELNGQLYCVGGSEGQRRLASCEMYDLNKGTWTFFASLNIGGLGLVCAQNLGGFIVSLS